MATYKDLNTVYNKTKRNSVQNSFAKEVASTSQISSKIDLRGLLELLNTTRDVNLHIKLFRSLSAYIIFDKHTNLDDIIKCSAVYDRIHDVLTKGLPRKATDALNFLSALLYVDAEEDATAQRRTLALYAKNMARISGCLGVMADLFTNCMMYHDTWKALCQCLAIACSGSEVNQNYCTHLIPPCIQKCSQTNIDIFLVLQSLVLDNKQNFQLFLDCNGISIFNRELLHYDKCLQLLTTVVQYSGAPYILRNTKVPDELRDFLRKYGPGSQIGQKAMIILNHIESRSRGLKSHTSKNLNKDNRTQPIKCSNDKTSREVENLDDTNILMQNVMKEIFNYKQNELSNLKETTPNGEVTAMVRGASAMNLNSINGQTHNKTTLNRTMKPLDQQQNLLHCNIATELSFTFLQNDYKDRHNTGNLNRTNIKGSKSNDVRTNKTETNKRPKLNIERDLSNFYATKADEKPTPVDLIDFRPIISSTPKHTRDSSNQIDSSITTMMKWNTTVKSQMTQNRTTKIKKQRIKKVARRKDKDLRNRSLSSRFLSAINESCTTLVKTVTNIFKKRESPSSSKNTTRSHSSPNQGDQSCSYSFLKYMQKRDAVLNNKLLKNRIHKNNSEFSSVSKSCETCNNTEVLKHKLAKDEHLKQTVKKLKLGINLYGCDFKKISRTMWPRESYMTPVVLYNLYRKLLLK